jgi:hypothetical protein
LNRRNSAYLHPLSESLANRKLFGFTALTISFWDRWWYSPLLLKNSFAGSTPKKHRVRMLYKRFSRSRHTFLVTCFSWKRSFSTASSVPDSNPRKLRFWLHYLRYEDGATHRFASLSFLKENFSASRDQRGPGDGVYARAAGMISSTSVPESLSLHTVSFPPKSFARSRMPRKP